MEKLLFYTKMNFGIEATGGIKNKVLAQKKAFEDLGFEVDFFYFENKVIKIENKQSILEHKTESKFAFLKYLFGGFLNDISIEDYSCMYVRHFLTNPMFIFLLYSIKKRNPQIKIFMEIPTFPYQFEFNYFSLIKRLELKSDLFSANYFKKYIDKIVTFSSKELIYGIPTIRTDNGIDTDKFGIIDPPAPFNGKEIHLLGLANMQKWHGLDRVIEGLSTYNKIPKNLKVYFHLVGRGDELQNLIDLVEKHKLSKYVLVHGFLSGKALETMFSTCHVGIGSLGMHRINAAKGETSALKSREFASRGMPFVIGYQDRGFPEKYPFIFDVMADETPIDIDSIITFYKITSAIPNFNKTMNLYAQEHLTWRAKLENVANNFRDK